MCIRSVVGDADPLLPAYHGHSPWWLLQGRGYYGRRSAPGDGGQVRRADAQGAADREGGGDGQGQEGSPHHHDHHDHHDRQRMGFQLRPDRADADAPLREREARRDAEYRLRPAERSRQRHLPQRRTPRRGGLHHRDLPQVRRAARPGETGGQGDGDRERERRYEGEDDRQRRRVDLPLRPRPAGIHRQVRKRHGRRYQAEEIRGVTVEPATIESGNAIPLLRTLGIALTEIGERHAVMEVVVEERHGNYFGGAHGGLIATLVE